MTIQAAIGGLQAIVGAVTGIKGAPSYAPEQLGVDMVAVCYPGEGEISIRVASEMQGLHDLVLEIHAARKNLPTDIAALIGFGDTVPKAILNDTTLGGNADTFGSIGYKFGTMTYNGQPTIGWRFTVKAVKIRSNL